ncbi:MAG: hypothetical protein ACP5FL_00685 [Thermoplasmatota archaeon]
MARYGSEYPEPPWVYSPQAVEDWLEATAPGTTVRESKGEKRDEYVEDVELAFDLDVEKTKVTVANALLAWLQAHLGLASIEEDFEVLPTAELLLRALHHAKFSNVLSVRLDGTSLYEHPEEEFDITAVVEQLAERSHAVRQATEVEIQARLDRVHVCTAVVHIRRIHPQRVHAIHVRFEGKMLERLLHAFLNYLQEHLELEITEG